MPHLGFSVAGFLKMAKKRVGKARSVGIARVSGTPEKGSERRRAERLPLGIPVFIRGLDEREESFVEFTTAWNVSSHGALVATKRQLSRSHPISLYLPFGPFPPRKEAPPHVQSVHATARWATQMDQFYLTGLKFSKPLKKLARTQQDEKVPSIF